MRLVSPFPTFLSVFSLGLGGLGEAWFPSPWFCGGCGGECGQTCLVCLLVTPPPSNKSCRRANNLETLCLIPGGLYLRNRSWFSFLWTSQPWDVASSHILGWEKHLLGCLKFYKNCSRIYLLGLLSNTFLLGLRFLCDLGAPGEEVQADHRAGAGAWPRVFGSALWVQRHAWEACVQMLANPASTYREVILVPLSFQNYLSLQDRLVE